MNPSGYHAVLERTRALKMIRGETPGTVKIWLNQPTASTLCSGCDSQTSLALKQQYAPPAFYSDGTPVPINNLYQLTNARFNTWRTTTPNKYDCAGKDVSSPYCHYLDWYYNQPNVTYSKQFFLNHPMNSSEWGNTMAPPYYYANWGNWLDTCSLSQPVSLVPGSLNIGMMDSSVRGVSINIDTAAWNALLKGQAPSNDLDNW